MNILTVICLGAGVAGVAVLTIVGVVFVITRKKDNEDDHSLIEPMYPIKDE